MTARHICISDLHCGVLTSLLTPTPDDPVVAPLSAAFARAMRKTIAALNAPDKPHLILLGDALDLSLAKPGASTASLANFLNALLSDDANVEGSPIGDMIIVPGNHDHLLWTADRLARKEARTRTLSIWSHSSPAFAKPDPGAISPVLDDVLALANVRAHTHIAYPNYGLTSQDGTRAVVFHHGHYVEPLYTLMSRLVAAFTGADALPDTAERLEQENAAWIDFFWSTVGDTGPLGKEMTLGYQYLLSGGQTDVFQRRLKRMLTEKLLTVFPLPKTGASAEAIELLSGGIIDLVVGRFSQAERFAYANVLGHESQLGLKTYLDGVVANQMKLELPHMPQDTTFIFGHTHKPFEDRVPVDNIPGPVGVINTGGWILDTTQLSTVEGASATFTDDDANTAVLKLFAPPMNGETVYARVTSVDGPDAEGNPMLDALKAAFAKTKDDWDAMSEIAAEAYSARQSLLLDHLADMNDHADRSETLV